MASGKRTAHERDADGLKELPANTVLELCDGHAVGQRVENVDTFEWLMDAPNILE